MCGILTILNQKKIDPKIIAKIDTILLSTKSRGDEKYKASKILNT